MDWFLYNNGLRHERVKCIHDSTLLFCVAKFLFFGWQIRKDDNIEKIFALFQVRPMISCDM